MEMGEGYDWRGSCRGFWGLEMFYFFYLDVKNMSFYNNLFVCMHDIFLNLQMNKINNIKKEYVERGYFLRRTAPPKC